MYLQQGVCPKNRSIKETNLLIREDLTSILFKLTNQAIEKYGLQNVWSLDGNAFAIKNNPTKTP